MDEGLGPNQKKERRSEIPNLQRKQKSGHKYSKEFLCSDCIVNAPADLLSHGLRIRDGCTEVPVPLQSTVQPRPVIMAVSRMWKTPWYKSVDLTVSRVTWLALCARTNSS